MKQELFKLIEQKSPGARPLYLVIRGSHAYGTNIETSDTDYAGVFIQSMDDIMGNKYKEQINDDKNYTVIYELRRFLELLASNNPTVLELLNTPEDCIIYKDPSFDVILENREKFITKVCGKSFGGYARQQIGKAKGQDKKQNWERDKVTRKTPLDFCYIYNKNKSIPLVDWLESRGMNQELCGLSKIPHCKDLYAIYYDNTINKSAKFKGIAFEDSNEVRLTSIDKEFEDMFIGYISYNKDGYSQHCKDYNSYQTWINERNEARWVDVKSHGQKIDGKNMMHCRRLMDMAREIGEGKGIIVRRPNAQELIDIRKGKIDLQSLIDHVEKEIKEVDKLFEESNLPDSVDNDFVNNLIIKIRKEVYNKLINKI
jgi:hypothetical protein